MVNYSYILSVLTQVFIKGVTV